MQRWSGKKGMGKQEDKEGVSRDGHGEAEIFIDHTRDLQTIISHMHYLIPMCPQFENLFLPRLVSGCPLTHPAKPWHLSVSRPSCTRLKVRTDESACVPERMGARDGQSRVQGVTVPMGKSGMPGLAAHPCYACTGVPAVPTFPFSLRAFLPVQKGQIGECAPHTLPFLHRPWRCQKSEGAAGVARRPVGLRSTMARFRLGPPPFKPYCPLS